MESNNDVERNDFERPSVFMLYTKLFGFQTSLDIISIVFSLFLITLGLLGFIQSGSKISLIASVAIAIPILISSYLIPKNMNWSFLSSGATLILFGQMTNSFLKSHRIYPSGVVALTSLIFLIFLNVRYFISRKNN